MRSQKINYTMNICMHMEIMHVMMSMHLGLLINDVFTRIHNYLLDQNLLGSWLGIVLLTYSIKLHTHVMMIEKVDCVG